MQHHAEGGCGVLRRGLDLVACRTVGGQDEGRASQCVERSELLIDEICRCPAADLVGGDGEHDRPSWIKYGPLRIQTSSIQALASRVPGPTVSAASRNSS